MKIEIRLLALTGSLCLISVAQDFGGFDSLEEYEEYQSQREIEKAKASEFMNTLIIIVSSILCPIMIVLVLCNCYIKYKRQQYLQKVRIA